jgi:hypothetical protein
MTDRGGIRSVTDRRKIQYTAYIPEKRSGRDRRKGFDRRSSIARRRGAERRVTKLSRTISHRTQGSIQKTILE